MHFRPFLYMQFWRNFNCVFCHWILIHNLAATINIKKGVISIVEIFDQSLEKLTMSRMIGYLDFPKKSSATWWPGYARRIFVSYLLIFKFGGSLWWTCSLQKVQTIQVLLWSIFQIMKYKFWFPDIFDTILNRLSFYDNDFLTLIEEGGFNPPFPQWRVIIDLLEYVIRVWKSGCIWDWNRGEKIVETPCKMGCWFKKCRYPQWMATRCIETCWTMLYNKFGEMWAWVLGDKKITCTTSAHRVGGSCSSYLFW